MPIIALEKKERQRILALVFVILLFLTFLVIFFGIPGGKKVRAPIVSPLKVKKVEINFGILENPLLKELQIFEEISFPEEKGRDNPFLPYETLPPPSE